MKEIVRFKEIVIISKLSIAAGPWSLKRNQASLINFKRLP